MTKSYPGPLLVAALVTAGVLAHAPQALAAEITLRLGHTNVTGSIQDMGAQKLRDLLEEKTDGRATIEIFPNGQIGDEAQLVEGVLLGTVQMAMTSNSLLSNVVTDFRVLDMPFMFPDIATLSAAQGLAAAGAIAAVPGIDGLVVGFNDLALSLGLTGRPDDPRLHAACARIAAAATGAGGVHGAMGLPAALIGSHALALGAGWIIAANEINLLHDAGRACMARLTPERTPTP